MKKRASIKKLQLNKKTIINLHDEEQNDINGGGSRHCSFGCYYTVLRFGCTKTCQS